MMWEQRRFGADQAIFAVIEHPEAARTDLIVTLSGLGQAMSEKNYLFSNLRKRLASKQKWVLQFDYRGHGDSAGELGDASLATMVSDTLEVLATVTKEHEPQRIFLVGNALGAVVAQTVSLEWEQHSGILCCPILISPPLSLAHSSEVFPDAIRKQWRKEGSLDSQLLIPGYDYYTLSDFNMEQYRYVTKLGAHLLYLHGQCIGYSLLEELDKLDPLRLFSQNEQRINLICGEDDKETIELALNYLPNATLHQLSGVAYYHQHPAAMDNLIDIIETIVV